MFRRAISLISSTYPHDISRPASWDEDTLSLDFKLGRMPLDVDRKYRYRGGDDGFAEVFSRCYIAYDRSGKAIRIIDAMRNITMQKRTEEVVLTIAKGVSTVAGHTFFHSRMDHLSKSLGADYAFVGELMKGHPGRVRTVVVWGQGRLVDNFEYDLAGTPCADVVRQRLCGYGSGIQQLFPLDQLLADMEIEGYVGAPLHDANKRTLGLLVVMFENPVENLALAESILNIFGVRAASELERQQKEEVLRESEQRLGLVLEATSSGVWDWNVQTGEVYFDDRWIKSLGYSPEEVSPHLSFWEQLIHPEDLSRVRKAWRDHFQGRSLVYEYENRMQTKSGTYRLNLDRGKVVEWDADGRPLRMVGTATDITNQKQAEEAIREARELSEAVIQSSFDGILAFDRDCRYTVWNPGMERLTGFKKEQTLDKCCFDVFPFLKEIGEDKSFFKALAGETFVVQDRPYVVPETGRQGFWEGSYSPLYGKSGEIVGGLVIVRDITTRKQMDEVLQALAVETASLTGEEFFPVLVRQLAAAVGTRYAFVTELVGDEQARAQVLAIWMGDRLGAPFEYNLIHTPCKVVFDRGSAYHPDSVQEIYSNDKDLVALEAMAYLGVTLKDSSGKPIGHLCVLDDKPLLNKHDSLMLINVFAARAAAELERKRAEQEQYRLIQDLTRSQQHFQALFNWTPSAVGISTVAEGRFIDVNDGFSRLTGYAREEVIGRTTLELGLWADSEERAFVLREIREQGYLHNREGLLRTKSGEIRSLMVSVESIRLGSTPCLIYLGHDITERKRAEEALRESEERYRTLMAYAPEAIVVLDVDRGRFVQVNENAVRLFGLSRETLLQAGPIELSPPTQPDGRSSSEAAVGLIRAAVNGGTPVFEWVHRTAAGADITCEVRLVRLPADGLVLVRGSVTDITARKQVEEALSESQRRFRELAENIKEVFWMSDPQKNEILYVSPAYEQIWGRTCESLYASPRSWLEAVHTEDRARILNAAVTKQAAGTYDEEYRRNGVPRRRNRGGYYRAQTG